jgi:4-diphosphocytidyl-2-C-methyl-D-erythritol kinase
MLNYRAPAKINLVLEVLGKRDDGYHEIRSLVQTINLCDVLEFKVANEISLECSEPDLEIPDNLVVRAAEALKEASGYKKGARIKLEKHIPWGTGLGGGSSDSATTLVALNRLWDLKLSISDLVVLAAKLGSDVPFFIHGGAALIEGRGEKIMPLPAAPARYFVLLIPPSSKIPDKTRRLYSLLETQHFTDGSHVDRALKSWSSGKRLTPGLFFNVFERVAFEAFPGLEDYRKRFEEAGARDIHLAGSGPALFASVNTEAEAEKVCGLLCQQGFEARSVSTVISGDKF